MDRKLHIVVPYPATNSSVRTRALHWIDRWAVETGRPRADVATVHGPSFPRTARPPDAPLLLLRNAHRFTRGRAEARLLRRAALGVYDLDDGLPWDDGALPGLGHWWKRPWPRSLLARRAAAAADRVVVGNDVLATWAADWCRDVVIVPTCVEPDDYAVRTTHAIDGPPVIGWIGSPATEHYLWAIAPALVELHRRVGARIEVISGGGAVDPQVAPFATAIPWSEAEARTRLATWDVGVMPLVDGVYERAKCGYKLLQYAAAGVPAVGSPVGVNRAILGSMDALAPDTVTGWIDALEQLVTEPADRRARRAVAGHVTASAYSYANWESMWRRAVGLADAAAVR